MNPKFFMKFLQILHGQLSGVHCLILCLKIFRPSEFFTSFGKFCHRTAPIVLIVSKPIFLVPIFLLVTVTPELKLQNLICQVLVIHQKTNFYSNKLTLRLFHVDCLSSYLNNLSYLICVELPH